MADSQKPIMMFGGASHVKKKKCLSRAYFFSGLT